MQSWWISKLFIVLFLMNSKTQASVIKFSAYPSILKANLTSSASMRCSLADTEHSGAQIGKRSTTSTAVDIFHISSIGITRNNGDDVASITPFDAPIAEADLGNLQVKGDLSGSSSTGYLELTWNDPSQIPISEYVCEINAIDSHHHSVVFTSQVELSEVEPTINDVITVLKQQTQELIQQKAKVTEQEGKIAQQEAKIRNLELQQVAMKDCAAQKVGFMAVVTNPSSKIYADGQQVVFDKIIQNEGGDYDQTTGSFICSKAGMYYFSVHSLGKHKNDINLNLKLNSEVITTAYSYGPGNSVETAAASALLHLKKDDTVHVVSYGTASEFFGNSVLIQGNAFTGFMVKNDCAV